MFLRSDQFEQSSGSAAGSPGGALLLAPPLTLADRIRGEIAAIDWTPDLGARIGSLDWFRGAATCGMLLAATYALSPGFARPIVGEAPAALKGQAWDNARAQGIAPLAWGGDTGQRLAASDFVRPLTETPDRPMVAFNSALGDGDSLSAVLQRAGASKSDVARIAGLVSGALPLDEIRPGTRFDGVLGRRAKKSDPRPIETLAFQPAFDFRLRISRGPDGSLTMERLAIAIDDTPLRIQGLAGTSLYKSLRAAGVPSTAAADYIKAMATRISVGGDVSRGDRFDIILKQRRAATGEVELGALEYAGLDLGGRKVQLVKWAGQDDDDADGNGGSWYDADGESQRNGFAGLPCAGRISSPFGMRFHPILGYWRMHKGIDVACAFGSPVYAVIDGTVNYAGFKGGYGQFVGIQSSSGAIGTGYAHLSRVLVRPGAHVARGEMVAYSGSSGLSTGPHLHFETYRNGVTVNPRGFSFSQLAALTGSALRAFKAKLASLMAVRVGTGR